MDDSLTRNVEKFVTEMNSLIEKEKDEEVALGEAQIKTLSPKVPFVALQQLF